jgi:uncharacterized protein YceH (UPF0502 family)
MPMYPQPETRGTVTTKHVLVTEADLTSAPLTAADATAPAATYGAPEQAIVANLQTRVNELEARLTAIGMLSN